MKNGAFLSASPRGKVSKKTFVLLISLVLLLTVAISGTVAFLADNTGEVENIFTSAEVTVGIDETLGDNTKSGIKFQNTGDVPAYIRATFVINWTNSENQIVPAPANGSVVVSPAGNDGNWVLDGDIYYYTPSVPVGGWTTEMPVVVTVNAPEGYTCHVDVYAEGVQATGDRDDNAVPAWQDAWFPSGT